MIHYHGTPVTPQSAAAEILRGRHALVSFSDARDIELVAELCQSFCIDNGAFTFWKNGQKKTNWDDFYKFLDQWIGHPSFDFYLIPDVIDGTEEDNDALVYSDYRRFGGCGVPVWHLHESLDRLYRLCGGFGRIALGSSGQYAQIGTELWWSRMDEVMNLLSRNSRVAGRPCVKLHGLRMLDHRLCERLPLSSADSTNVARNIGIDSKWRGSYQPPDRAWRGNVLAARIESHQSAPCYIPEAETQPALFSLTNGLF